MIAMIEKLADRVLQFLGAVLLCFLVWSTFTHLTSSRGLSLGKHLRLVDATGQVWIILPRDVQRVMPDFANPHLIRVWMDGGGQIALPVERQAEIEQALK